MYKNRRTEKKITDYSKIKKEKERDSKIIDKGGAVRLLEVITTKYHSFRKSDYNTKNLHPLDNLRPGNSRLNQHVKLLVGARCQ